MTVLIGENGSGKSNILEGIGFAAAAAADKLDGEFLFNRGIRVTDWKWMMSAFEVGESGETTRMNFHVRDQDLKGEVDYWVKPFLEVSPLFPQMEAEFSYWEIMPVITEDDVNIVRKRLSEGDRKKILEMVQSAFQWSDETRNKQIERSISTEGDDLGFRLAAGLFKQVKDDEFTKATTLADFLIYAPENTVLRTPPPEGAIQPVGTKGEGLFRLLQTFADPKNAERLADLKERLRLFDWFEDFLVPDESATAQARIQIRDKWLAPERAIFDQRSANEGFLYLLFYFTVIMSARTPRFFAFDNVDNALNPKLCSTLMKQITELAKKYGKQVICTTHNAAILDGLDLEDDDVRLFTVRRDSEGHTALHRVKAPKPQPGETPVRLSEAFMRGILGGLPDHF